MAAKRFLDVGETAAALEKAGFSKNDASRVLMLFAVNDRVKASELNALLASAREIGPHNVYTFLGGGALFSAFRQLKKPGFKRHKERHPSARTP